MNRPLLLFMTAGLLMGGEEIVAQNASPMLFTTYFKCDQNREVIADMIHQEVMAPILDRHVAAGQLGGWGWLAHRVGGSWRRAEFMTAPDLPTLLSARNEMIQERQSSAAASAELNDICPDHDDYIWTQVSASPAAPAPPAGQTPAPARMTTYYTCNAGQEARADQLFNESMAPIFNRHTGDAALRAWGWWAHVVGGEYRRFLTMNAVDADRLYTHWGAAVTDIRTQAPAALEEFSRICSSHTDYEWAAVLPPTDD